MFYFEVTRFKSFREYPRLKVVGGKSKLLPFAFTEDLIWIDVKKDLVKGVLATVG